jgi:VCBS repeat-containing protein
LKTSCTDSPCANCWAAAPGVFVGTYGTLTLNADGTYTYTPGVTLSELPSQSKSLSSTLAEPLL